MMSIWGNGGSCHVTLPVRGAGAELVCPCSCDDTVDSRSPPSAPSCRHHWRHYRLHTMTSRCRWASPRRHGDRHKLQHRQTETCAMIMRLPVYLSTSLIDQESGRIFCASRFLPRDAMLVRYVLWLCLTQPMDDKSPVSCNISLCKITKIWVFVFNVVKT